MDQDDDLEAAPLFATWGQVFGRIGNLINGDIIGYPSTLPWSTVYDNPNSFACPNPSTCHVPVQPAAGYELLLNVVLIVLLAVLARRYRRLGALILTYLFGYVITQFLVFFARANVVVPLFSLNRGLKQAQWTSLIVLLLLVPLTFLVLRLHYAEVVPEGLVPATYGIPQKHPRQDEVSERRRASSKASRKRMKQLTQARAWLLTNPERSSGDIFRELQRLSLERYQPLQIRTLQRGMREIRACLLATLEEQWQEEVIHG